MNVASPRMVLWAVRVAAGALLVLALYLASFAVWLGLVATLLAVIVCVGVWLLPAVLPSTQALAPSNPFSMQRLGFLSHSMRSPVTSILALVESVRLTNRGGDVADELNKICDYANLSLRSSEQLTHLLRAENLPSLKRTDLDFLAVVEEAQARLLTKARRKSVKLVIETQSDTDYWTHGQQDLLEPALINLVDNAVKYSHEGGQVRLQLTTQNNWLVCRVLDEGIGMTADESQQALQHYGRLPSAPPALNGAGLGLHLVQAIVARHGGKLTMSCQAGGGCCVTLSLPLVKVSG